MVDLHITCEVLLESITMGGNVSTRYIQEPKSKAGDAPEDLLKTGAFCFCF